jgi:ariadne-1
MSCRCGFEFCWMCGAEWRTHKGNAYRCNRFRDFEDRVGGRRRLHHYHTMHLEHIRSRERELLGRAEVRERMVAKFDVDGGGGLRLADRVFNAIDRAREILIWSFPHAFYMQPWSPELRLFEFWQGDVARDVEELTDLVEHESVGATTETIYKAVTVLTTSTDVLVRHVGEITDWAQRQEVAVGPSPFPATKGRPWREDEKPPDEEPSDEEPPEQERGGLDTRLQLLLDMLMGA